MFLIVIVNITKPVNDHHTLTSHTALHVGLPVCLLCVCLWRCLSDCLSPFLSLCLSLSMCVFLSSLSVCYLSGSRTVRWGNVTEKEKIWLELTTLIGCHYITLRDWTRRISSSTSSKTVGHVIVIVNHVVFTSESHDGHVTHYKSLSPFLIIIIIIAVPKEALDIVDKHK